MQSGLWQLVQVVLARTISNQKNLRSVATKVAIQLNCKLGGEAWCLEIPLTTAMIIGYDTYHDSSTKGQSAGAFVASMNRTFTRWYSRVTFHKTHQELGNTLAKNLLDAIGRYSQINGGAIPDRIFFFRDGVSDGQIPQVRSPLGLVYAMPSAPFIGPTYPLLGLCR